MLFYLSINKFKHLGKAMALDKVKIHKIVREFYKVATTDFLIGYQFRKIAEFQSSNPLAPPIEAFDNHIPRIVSFWELQLNGKTSTPIELPFNLIVTHEYLSMRKGEIGRWVTLFNQTVDIFLKENSLKVEEIDSIALWRERVELFQKKFIESKVLFPKN